MLHYLLTTLYLLRYRLPCLTNAAPIPNKSSHTQRMPSPPPLPNQYRHLPRPTNVITSTQSMPHHTTTPPSDSIHFPRPTNAIRLRPIDGPSITQRMTPPLPSECRLQRPALRPRRIPIPTLCPLPPPLAGSFASLKVCITSTVGVFLHG